MLLLLLETSNELDRPNEFDRPVLGPENRSMTDALRGAIKSIIEPCLTFGPFALTTGRRLSRGSPSSEARPLNLKKSITEPRLLATGTSSSCKSSCPFPPFDLNMSTND